MKSFTTFASLFAILAGSANAQIVYNTTTHMLECTAGGRAYCGNWMPLSTNIIIRCYGRRAVPANCNDNLAGVDPIGVKDSALCYEASPMAGGAACYYDGLVYPDDGNTYALPPGWTQFLHNATNGSLTTTTSTTSTISLNFPTVPGPVLPTAASTGMPTVASGSGGYNYSVVTGTGLAPLTGLHPHPRPTTTGASISPPIASVPSSGGARKTPIRDIFLYWLFATAFSVALVTLL